MARNDNGFHKPAALIQKNFQASYDGLVIPIVFTVFIFHFLFRRRLLECGELR